MMSAKLKRAVSFDVTVVVERSSRKGYRNSDGGGEGSSRERQIGWLEQLSFLRSSPFVVRGVSLKGWMRRKRSRRIPEPCIIHKCGFDILHDPWFIISHYQIFFATYLFIVVIASKRKW